MKHFFGNHQWKVISAAYVAPKAAAFRGLDFMDECLIHGFTTIVEHCECGMTRDRSMLGDHSGIKQQSELNELERMIR